MLGGLCNSMVWLVVLGAAMGVVERFAPAHPAQRFFRSGFVTDVIYWLTPYFFYGPLAPRPLTALTSSLWQRLTGAATPGFAFIAAQPHWVQAIEAFLIADFLSYWAHRWLHGRSLWAFHAVHHGPVELDWLSTIRNHPINVVIQRLVLTLPLLALGFPVAAILAMAPLSALYNLFTHANLDWRFGKVGYVLVSPVMHRWHHALETKGCNSNFGEALAIWDALFGTYYLPDHLPHRLGLENGPPDDFVGQTLWPIHYFMEPTPQTIGASRA